MKIPDHFLRDLSDIDQQISELESDRVDIVNRIDNLDGTREKDAELVGAGSGTELDEAQSNGSEQYQTSLHLVPRA
jgi:hypothetical protein